MLSGTASISPRGQAQQNRDVQGPSLGLQEQRAAVLLSPGMQLQMSSAPGLLQAKPLVVTILAYGCPCGHCFPLCHHPVLSLCQVALGVTCAKKRRRP